MDVQKIGRFLTELRKTQNLTQEELGEKLGVTNKTVSRWENGNYLPPVEILQLLSNLYGVSINELLYGERLNTVQYKESAEDYIVSDLLKKRNEAKKRIALSIIISVMTIISALSVILLSAGLPSPLWLKIFCIALAVIISVLGISVCCVLTVDAGVYECPVCGEKFVPTLKDFVFGVHTLTKRKLKCPKCGKKSFCKKRLN